MTSKERVNAALRGKGADRVPMFLWYSAKTVQNLAEYLGIREDEVDDALHNDIKQDWLSINRQMTVPCEDGKTFVDEWGITWKRDGEYNTAIRHPLAEADAEEIKKYPFPAADLPSRYDGTARLMRKYPDHFIGADVSGSLFEPGYHLRGMENLLVDMMTESEEADVLLDRLKAFTEETATRALQMGCDWIWLGDDFGTQQNMIASPEIWRKYLKPRYAEIIAALRKIRSDIPVAFHSGGSIRPIIGDLQEIGVTVLNPIQESAAGMSHEQIRREFPDLTMFCGLDTQQYLVHASPGEVYERALREIELLGKHGKYIYGCSHTIQHDVPPENILALVKAGLDYGKV